MHLLRVDSRSIDGAAEAVDLGQTPAEIVALSFTDADLAVLAAAWGARGGPTLRLANLGTLRHPYSIDLYIEKVLSRARFVLVRLLGGKDYWRYGVDELAMAARSGGFHLAIVPGDERVDARLDEASTLPVEALRQIWGYFSAGGVANVAACLDFAAGYIRPGDAPSPLVPPPVPVPAFGLIPPIAPPSWPGLTRPSRHGQCAASLFRTGLAVMAGSSPAMTGGREAAFRSHSPPPSPPRALIVFYRAWMLAADTAPVTALADALWATGFDVAAAYVTSLKDPAAAVPLRAHLADHKPDIILNLTAFSARSDAGISVLDHADVPVLQLALSGSPRPQWESTQRGLSAADLAMNVVLPEFDGRITAGAISFKGETERNEALEFARLVHQPDPDGVAHAAALARGWADLRRTPRAERRVACVLSDYPAKAGRTGYAVGLDTPRSVAGIAAHLAAEGFTVGPLDETALIAALTSGDSTPILSLSEYRRLLATLPASLVEAVNAAWGEPEDDPSVRVLRTGNLLIAVQPDRGTASSRKADYHDPALPPRHGYIAFYLWLRHIERVHAIIHCGTHGTLEWLPGKAVALSAACAPRAVLGPVPLIYPFIVNNPGEAAQAKRRTAAVTIGHLTPPLEAAGTHGAAAELESLFDEYAEAQSLDPRRATRLSELILARAWETGLAAESGLTQETTPADALPRLDAWLCDLKDQRIGDGLHVFGQAAHGDAELRGLLAALDGRFVPPGPAGSPDRGRLDVLPTGRNLYGIDPRAVPTRTAWEIGRRTAEAMLTRHLQDHGEWPLRVVLDIWGSSTMRTGGDDLAQAFALLGVRPAWDDGSNRVSGFDIMPLAVLNRPRIDVTLRISGLFRDVFPSQIALFDQVVRAVAALEEAPEDNPLAASDAGPRIFGTAPGAYGVGIGEVLAEGTWSDRDQLGEAYLQATSHAYGAADPVAVASFRDRVAQADAFVHVQDLPGQDVLDADAVAEHAGGFAAASALLGGTATLYHADTTDPEASKIRTLREEVARILRARATNPRWIAGQMRHGYRGAAEIASTVDNLFAFAALTEMVDDRQFDLLFDATIGDEAVRRFLSEANPAAASAIAARFEEAISRGLWTTRRNAPPTILASLR
jgi:cobaltochelatase CobN